MALSSLEILDRRLARVKQEHLSDLSSALNGGISVFDPRKKFTISEGIDLYREATARAQAIYGEKLREEILLHIDQANISIDISTKEAFMKIISKHLNDQLYESRFDAYLGALKRHISRYGMEIDLKPYRTDIAGALYSVGSMNFVRSSASRISDELELLTLRNTNQKIISTLPPLNSNQVKASTLEQANKFIKLEPNMFGIGLNINYLIRRLMGKKE